MVIAATAVAWPHAASAETRIEGVSYAHAFDDPSEVVVYSARGLTIVARCELETTPPDESAQFTLVAQSEKDDATVHVGMQREDDQLGYVETDDLDPGEELDLGTLESSFAANANESGRLLYTRPTGATVSVAFGAYAAYKNMPTGLSHCGLTGVARASGAAPDDQGTARKLAFEGVPGTIGEPFEAGGLRLRASCVDGPQLRLVASSRHAHAIIHATSSSAGPAGSYAERDDFETGGPAGRIVLSDELTLDDGTGQIIFGGDGGKQVSIDWIAEEGGSSPCLFAGTARVAKPEDPDAIDFRAEAGDRETLVSSGELHSLSAICTEPTALSVEASWGLSGSSFYGTALSNSGNGYRAIPRLAGPSFVQPDVLDEIGGSDDAAGLFLIRAARSGTWLAIDWLAEEEQGFGGRYDCAFIGTMDIVPVDSP